MSGTQIREVDTNEMLMGIRKFLYGLGLDMNDQHLQQTPERVVKAWVNEFASGYSLDPKEILSVEFADDCDEMIVVKNIPFTSHCIHHLVQFSGTAKIGYVPKGKITGLSKLARVLDVFAKRLQIQERLTKQIALAIQEHLKPVGTGVVLSAGHSCMECRGVQKPGSITITSCLLGGMRTDKAMREEFLNF